MDNNPDIKWNMVKYTVDMLYPNRLIEYYRNNENIRKELNDKDKVGMDVYTIIFMETVNNLKLTLFEERMISLSIIETLANEGIYHKDLIFKFIDDCSYIYHILSTTEFNLKRGEVNTTREAFALLRENVKIIISTIRNESDVYVENIMEYFLPLNSIVRGLRSCEDNETEDVFINVMIDDYEAYTMSRVAISIADRYSKKGDLITSNNLKFIIKFREEAVLNERER